MAATITPKFAKTENVPTDQNFAELKKILGALHPLVSAKMTGNVELAVGTTRVKPPLAKPSGRILVYQSAASDISDSGLDGDGYWVFTSSAACTCRFLFF